jgi:hypothetical protein
VTIRETFQLLYGQDDDMVRSMRDVHTALNALGSKRSVCSLAVARSPLRSYSVLMEETAAELQRLKSEQDGEIFVLFCCLVTELLTMLLTIDLAKTDKYANRKSRAVSMLQKVGAKASEKAFNTLSENVSKKLFGDKKYFEMASELHVAVSEITPSASSMSKRMLPSFKKKPTPPPPPAPAAEPVSTSRLKQTLNCFIEELFSFRRMHRMDVAVSQIKLATPSTSSDNAAATNVSAVQKVLQEFREDISNFGKQFFTALEGQHPSWKKALNVVCVHHKQTNQFAWVDKKAEAKYLNYMNKVSRSGAGSSSVLHVRGEGEGMVRGAQAPHPIAVPGHANTSKSKVTAEPPSSGGGPRVSPYDSDSNLHPLPSLSSTAIHRPLLEPIVRTSDRGNATSSRRLHKVRRVIRKTPAETHEPDVGDGQAQNPGMSTSVIDTARSAAAPPLELEEQNQTPKTSPKSNKKREEVENLAVVKPSKSKCVVS